ncbi:MAG: N-acetyltransferase family protein [Candidatus Chromulinivorax sp.]
MWFQFLIILIGCEFLFTQDEQRFRYMIREATIEDKSELISLYKNSKEFYSPGLNQSKASISYLVSSRLHAALDHGFAFVVQDVSDQNYGKVLAALLKIRPLGVQYRHIVNADGGLMIIHPAFREYMFGTKLYRHLLRQIEEHHHDVLRVEAACPDFANENIALLERCGFIIEGKRSKCFRMSHCDFADEIVFVWWNKNFDANASRLF